MLRGDISHQHDLPKPDSKVYGKLQGQVADQPLVNSEQFAGGGLGTVRGYLEAEVLGDDGVAGDRRDAQSQRIVRREVLASNEWRFYLFAEGGYYTLVADPLPQQTSDFELASVGLGTRVHWHELFQRLHRPRVSVNE